MGDHRTLMSGLVVERARVTLAADLGGSFIVLDVTAIALAQITDINSPHFYRIREGGGSGRPPHRSFENR